MKGPFERLKYDLRRIWECPACGAKQRTDGSVTTRFCTCGKPNSNPQLAMKLVSDGPRRTVPPIPPPLIEPEPDGAAPAEPPLVGVPALAGEPVVDAVTQLDVIASATETTVAVTEVKIVAPPVDPAGPSS